MDNLIPVVGLGIAFAVFLLLGYGLYRNSVKKLNALTDARWIKPGKARFIFTWCIEYLLGIIAGCSFLWLVDEKEIPYILLFIMFFSMVTSIPAAYAYYTLAIHHGRLNGPSQWGWRWQRIEIQLDKIDRARTLRPTLGRKLGFTTIFSTSGEKIMAQGLDDQQLAAIMQAAEDQVKFN